MKTIDPNVFETANAGFAQALYEDFLRDPESVPAEWRELFESGRVGEAPGNGARGSGLGTRTSESEPQTTRPESRIPSPESRAPIKGPAARLVQNMTESLSVPTATSFREIAVGALEEARARFNAGLQASGRTEKASFTHFIAWALVRAAVKHPVMGHTLTMVDGTPHRVMPDGVHLGLAVDVTRKDGSRGLVVPVVRHAEAMSYADFHAAYDALVDKARTNRLMPDAFVGGTITLTNPGGIGTGAAALVCMAIGWTVAIYPPLWIHVFSDDADVIEIGSLYMRMVAPFYPLFGAGLALLLAPSSGEELRRNIRRSARRAQRTAGHLARDASERASEAIADARKEFESRVDDARDMIRERRHDVTDAVRSGRAAARDARTAFERRLAEARASRSEPETSGD